MSDRLEQARQCFLAAVQHHEQGRLEEAEALYRQADGLMPRRESVQMNLAALLAQQQRFAEAVALCTDILELNPGQVQALLLAAHGHLELDQVAQSLERAGQAVRAAPSMPEAWVTRARALLAGGHADEALEACARALALAPRQAEALDLRALALARLGRGAEALRAYCDALAADPQSATAQQGFCEQLQAVRPQPGQRDKVLEGLALRALAEGWTWPNTIVRPLLALVEADPPVRELLDRCADPQWPLPALDAPALQALLHDSLFAGLLEHVVINNVRFERLLTRLRAALLREAAAAEAAPAHLRFHCALARQCFINDHAFALQPGEEAQLAALRARLEERTAGGQPAPAAWVAAIACYLPLHQLAGAATLLDVPWNADGAAAMGGLLTQQIREPLAELQLRTQMPQLTAVADEVSRKVQGQYEHHPYPRWVKTGRWVQRRPLALALQKRVGTLPWPVPWRESVSALVAGCGTGRHPIETARRYSGIAVLAVDLSLSSLAYAQRKAGEMGIGNLRFAQADILELGSLGQSFDLIESVGVLHHLRDPGRGLAVLAGLLRKGGVMNLGLYSELARREIVAARSFIATRGFASDDAGMRSCRQALMALPEGSPGRGVIYLNDFYSLSDCRDLLFHVQEHRYTVPDLVRLLAPHGLRFLGFELEPRWIERYRAQFPDDPGLRSLANWHAFELRHPEVFTGMYQFWVQKPA